jgi:hypothetical protein
MSHAQFLIGDTRQVLRRLPDASVDLVLTSPPFLALRSYLPADHPDKALEMGSEGSPGLFLDALLDVVEQCARVLAPHGSIAIELGDTFSGGGGAGGDYAEGGLRDGQPKFRAGTPRWDGRPDDQVRTTTSDPVTYPARGKQGWPLDKSLTLIPELFRFALAYGLNPLTGRETSRWRVRNVVRWCRPNPPVGALGDKFRPATSDMVIACKARDRYFDLDAVRQASSDNSHARTAKGVAARPSTGKTADDARRGGNFSSLDTQHASSTAPPLDWWKIPTQAYPGQHYATWPEQLCVIPIKAMCPLKVCTTCGEPSRRIAETVNSVGRATARSSHIAGATGHARSDAIDVNDAPDYAERRTLGFTCCGCCGSTAGTIEACPGGHWRTGVVLDPFAGSGTTLAVATGHGRDAIGIDLDAQNAELAMQRVGPLLLTVQ